MMMISFIVNFAKTHGAYLSVAEVCFMSTWSYITQSAVSAMLISTSLAVSAIFPKISRVLKSVGVKMKKFCLIFVLCTVFFSVLCDDPLKLFRSGI